MQQKKIPQRLCCGCGEMKPKRELVRISKSADGVISYDVTGKRNGRGAYICPTTQCLEKAKKGKRLERAFGCRIEESLFEELYNEFSKQAD